MWSFSFRAVTQDWTRMMDVTAKLRENFSDNYYHCNGQLPHTAVAYGQWVSRGMRNLRVSARLIRCPFSARSNKANVFPRAIFRTRESAIATANVFTRIYLRAYHAKERETERMSSFSRFENIHASVARLNVPKICRSPRASEVAFMSAFQFLLGSDTIRTTDKCDALNSRYSGMRIF